MDYVLRLTANVVLSFAMIFTWQAPPANAWSLKTHVWIAQQILNDAEDGQLTIAGRNYNIPPNILSAIKQHPARFRMGSMGPDVFPDPIVGQITTHPGVEGGWQTDDWLKHILGRAKTDEEVAFSYGFLTHAAGDIFAHTYVNAYAGDIFSLIDTEREVELRHFVLEKYIESLTPHPVDSQGRSVNFDTDLGTATSFLRDTLIKGGEVAAQNARSKGGVHLTGMHAVRHAVTELQTGTQDVISTLTKWAAEYFETYGKLQADIATGKLALEALKLELRAEELLLKAKEEVYDAALYALDEANNIVQKHPELITFNEQLLAKQIEIAADLAVEALKVGAEVAKFIDSLEGTVDDLLGDLAKLTCKVFGVIIKKCEEIIDEVKDLRRRISIANARREVAERASREAAQARDDLKELVQKLKDEYEKAVQGIANKTYEAAIFAAKTDLDLQRKVLGLKQGALREAEEIQERLSKELDKISPIIDMLKKAIDRYNPVTLLIQKWIDDIDVGMEEYIKAGHRAGIIMLKSSGNPLAEYQEWLACYGQVFRAVPKESGQAGCLLKNFVRDVKDEFDRIIDDLPEIVRWIVAPSREIQKRVEEKVRPELEEAAFRLVAFLSDKRTAEFLELLTQPKNATRDKLNEVYRKDESGKRLLLFDDVANFVDSDLDIRGGVLTPASFPAIAHAVTLAKLTLLDPGELNRLVRDLAGTHPFIPARGVFPPHVGHYSILLNAVRSIDGNHQWQAYGLSYPRRLGTAPASPIHSHYGRDGFRESGKGFPIWTDVFLRERVFLKLFAAPILGKLSERKELQWRHYRFPSCAQNPYPATQDPRTGAVQEEDPTCVLVSMPNRSPEQYQPASQQEFRDRYFQCGSSVAGLPHWTVAGSYRSEPGARRAADSVRRSFPDMVAEVWRPQGRNKYWTLMLAACTSEERANEALDIAIRRRIALDAFVWRPSLPWAKGP